MNWSIMFGCVVGGSIGGSVVYLFGFHQGRKSTQAMERLIERVAEYSKSTDNLIAMAREIKKEFGKLKDSHLF